MRFPLAAVALVLLGACVRPHTAAHHDCLDRCEAWNRTCVLDARSSQHLAYCSQETSRCVRSCPY